jgi:hypothetical protein
MNNNWPTALELLDLLDSTLDSYNPDIKNEDSLRINGMEKDWQDKGMCNFFKFEIYYVQNHLSFVLKPPAKEDSYYRKNEAEMMIRELFPDIFGKLSDRFGLQLCNFFGPERENFKDQPVVWVACWEKKNQWNVVFSKNLKGDCN